MSTFGVPVPSFDKTTRIGDRSGFLTVIAERDSRYPEFPISHVVKLAFS